MDACPTANPDEFPWRDAQVSKQGRPGLRQALEQRAARDPDLSGCRLRQVSLEAPGLFQQTKAIYRNLHLERARWQRGRPLRAASRWRCSWRCA